MSTPPIPTRPHRLGLDFGGVIYEIGQVPGHTTRASEDPDYLNRPAIPHAIESIKKLVTLFGPENAFIVSRVSVDGEQKVRNWLYYHSFWEQIGVSRDNIRFCRERHEKGPICAELDITHFVDDRLECLVGMDTVPHRYRLSSEPPDIEIPHFPSPGFTHYTPETRNNMPILGTHSWPELLSYLEDFLMGC